jgi:hypothetical protein
MDENSTDEVMAGAKTYSVKDWSLRDFVTAWAGNQNHSDWSSFHEAMAAECLEATGSVIPEMNLLARLRTSARHLEEKGYTPPNYPARPVPEAETLMSVMDDLAGELGIAYDPSKDKRNK